MPRTPGNASQPAPQARWRAFYLQAHTAIAKRGGYNVATNEGWETECAREIVSAGHGPAFLAAVRRGRPTQRQELRYLLLREVEKLIGDAVPRRRPDANTPDSLALRQPVPLELAAPELAGLAPGAE